MSDAKKPSEINASVQINAQREAFILGADPERSAWVSANAGTGKTHLLTSRVIRLLLSGVSPGHILCLTYTKAAAGEMMQRIASTLSRWASQPAEALREEIEEMSGKAASEPQLVRARRLLHETLNDDSGLRVQTIHSFCQKLLQRFPIEAGLPPQFKVMDDQTSSEMIAEIKAVLFAEAGKNSQSAISAAIYELSAHSSEEQFRQLLDWIIDKRSLWNAWFDSPKGAIALIDAIYTSLGLSHDANEAGLIRAYTDCSAQRMLQARKLAEIYMEGGVRKTISDLLIAWAENPEARELVALDYASLWLKKDGKPQSKLLSAAAQKKAPDLAEFIESEQQRAVAFLAGIHDLAMARRSANVVIIAAQLHAMYRQRKAQAGLLDYDDLLHLANGLLRDSHAAAWVRFKLDYAIRHVLVDEAQDTSLEQWDLVKALTEEFHSGEGAAEAPRSLLVVGDTKQSIFSFQGAAPEAFEGAQRGLTDAFGQAGLAIHELELTQSRRSAPLILSLVDHVFTTTAAAQGVQSAHWPAHSSYHCQRGGLIALYSLSEKEKPLKMQGWTAPEAPQRAKSAEYQLAERIGSHVAQWLQEGKPLPNRNRAVRPEDVLILVQRRGTLAPWIIRQLTQRGIPVSGADRLRLCEHLAIEDMLAAAQWALFGLDDLSLASVLKSPLFGLSEDALFQLAYNREGTLFASLQNMPELEYQSISQTLSYWQITARSMNAFDFFGQIIELPGVRRRYAEAFGDEAEDVLNEFLGLCQTYDRAHIPSVQGFVHWVSSRPFTIKREMEKASGKVRVMTVHGAKGLEAPIVILADAHRPFGSSSNKPPMLVDERQSRQKAIPYFVSKKLGDIAFSPFCRQLKKAIDEQQRAEYHRLLYVALTRAADELHVFGANQARREESWYGFIEASMRAMGAQPEASAGERTLMLDTYKAPEKFTPYRAAVAENAPTLPAYLMPSGPAVILSQSSTSIKRASTGIAAQRGIAVHRVLQHIGTLNAHTQRRVCAYLQAYPDPAVRRDAEALAQQVMQLVQHPEYGALFAQGALAEVPVAALDASPEGAATATLRQIDRLCITEMAVTIVDYKTTQRFPKSTADVPEAYLKQMASYRELLRKIYPGREVVCYLLWTAGPLMMKLDGALLDESLRQGLDAAA